MGSKVYQRSMAALDKVVPTKFLPLWKHPAGPKTVFFWAPLFKWGLVIAGISDLKRPVEKLSISQTISLAVSGLIWSRWSLIIEPVNYSLFSVNMFVGGTQLVQLYRAVMYQRSLNPPTNS